MITWHLTDLTQDMVTALEMQKCALKYVSHIPEGRFILQIVTLSLSAEITHMTSIFESLKDPRQFT
jgi:hypothetical protein